MTDRSRAGAPADEPLSATWGPDLAFNVGLNLLCNLLTEFSTKAALVVAAAGVSFTVVRHSFKRWRRTGRRPSRRLTALVVVITVVQPLLLVGTGAFLSRDRPPAESTGHTRPTLSVTAEVANQTRGDVEYAASTSARYDDVVKFSVTLENHGDSVLRGVVPTFRFVDGPDTEGGLETRLAVGHHTITRSTTVELGRADAALRFIEGSLYWKHQISQPNDPAVYRTDHLDDASVINGGSYPLQSLLPGETSSLTLMARSTVPSVSIDVGAKTRNATWRSDVAAAAGDKVDTRILLRNLGNLPIRDVTVRASPAPGLALNSLDDTGDVAVIHGGRRSSATARDLSTWGVRVEELAPGEVAQVRFTMTLSPAAESGADLRTVGIVSSAELDEYYNTLILAVD